SSTGPSRSPSSTSERARHPWANRDRELASAGPARDLVTASHPTEEGTGPMNSALLAPASLALAGLALFSLQPPQARPGAPPPAAKAGKVDLGREHRPGRVVLRFAKGTPDAALAGIAGRVDARSSKVIWPGLLASVVLAPDADLQAALD